MQLPMRSVLVAAVLTISGVSTAEAQLEVGVTAGQSLIQTGIKSSGQFIWDCDESGAFISYLGLELAKDWFAVHVALNHTDWPWAALGAAGEESTGPPNVIQRHGDAIEALALFRPAEAFDLKATHREGYTFNPHIGVGVQVARDADDTSPAQADLYLAQGQTDLMIAYGFTFDVHPASLAASGFALRVGLTGKRVFRSDASFMTPTGVQTFDSDNADWATLSFGVVYRPGR